MSKLVYLVHIEPIPKGGFYVTVPALPGCRLKAKTLDVALRKSKDEIRRCLIRLVKTRKPIPIESQKIRPLCVPIRVEAPKKGRAILASELGSK